MSAKKVHHKFVAKMDSPAVPHCGSEQMNPAMTMKVSDVTCVECLNAMLVAANVQHQNMVRRINDRLATLKTAE